MGLGAKIPAMSKIEEKLVSMGLSLPPAPAAVGVYKPVVVHGTTMYLSGQGPVRGDGTLILGRVGDDFNTDQGYDAARQVGLTMLATIKSQIGNLDAIVRIVKTLGMVNCTPDFPDHPKVINGFSDLMAAVLGDDRGIGARSAVGMMLPTGIAAEIESIFEVDPSLIQQ